MRIRQGTALITPYLVKLIGLIHDIKHSKVCLLVFFFFFNPKKNSVRKSWKNTLL